MRGFVNPFAEMTYQKIAAKRAQARKDKELIINGIKRRILFITLTICTAMTSIAIHALAYVR